MAARAAPPPLPWASMQPFRRLAFRYGDRVLSHFLTLLVGARLGRAQVSVLPTLPSVCPLENARRALDRSGCVAGVASYVIHLCCKRIAPASDHMTAHSCYCAAGGPSSEDVHVLASGGIRSWAPFSPVSLSCCRPCSDREPRAWRLGLPPPLCRGQACNRFVGLLFGTGTGSCPTF